MNKPKRLSLLPFSRDNSEASLVQQFGLYDVKKMGGIILMKHKKCVLFMWCVTVIMIVVVSDLLPLKCLVYSVWPVLVPSCFVIVVGTESY